MNLNFNPENVQWPTMHFVFVEKIGPFQSTARQSWEMAHSKKSEIAAKNKISNHVSPYKMEPEMIYRAGFVVDAKPENIPDGFKYEKFSGGAYAKFILTRSYSNLAEACGQVFSKVDELKLSIRDGFLLKIMLMIQALQKKNNLLRKF